jgi:hypothetical protein
MRRLRSGSNQGRRLARDAVTPIPGVRQRVLPMSPEEVRMECRRFRQTFGV